MFEIATGGLLPEFDAVVCVLNEQDVLGKKNTLLSSFLCWLIERIVDI